MPWGRLAITLTGIASLLRHFRNGCLGVAGKKGTESQVVRHEATDIREQS